MYTDIYYTYVYVCLERERESKIIPIVQNKIAREKQRNENQSKNRKQTFKFFNNPNPKTSRITLKVSRIIPMRH